MKEEKQSTNPPATEESEELSYNMRVKKRLIEWKDSYEERVGMNLNYTAIAEIMQSKFNIQTSTQKIGAMFDSQSKREVKLQELAALSQIFNIPIQNICEYPNAPSSDIDRSLLVRGKSSKQGPLKQLDNNFYQGTYYCYYFEPKDHQDYLAPVQQTELEEAKLTIDIKQGHTVLTLQELKSRKAFYGQTMPSFTLTGDLYLFENTEMAYALITDPSGRRAMSLMFSFLNLSADVRYYITAGMMTFSSNQTHSPLFQKMAIFRKRQDHKDSKSAEVLRGILALNSSPIVMEENQLNELLKEDPQLNSLITENIKKNCCIISEDALLNNSFSSCNGNEKIQKVLKLKKNSLLPAHELVSESELFADFIRAYQQTQDTDQ